MYSRKQPKPRQHVRGSARRCAGRLTLRAPRTAAALANFAQAVTHPARAQISSMKGLAAKALLVLLTANAVGAQTNSFQCQLITLPINATASHFVDVDNDGR